MKYIKYKNFSHCPVVSELTECSQLGGEILRPKCANPFFSLRQKRVKQHCGEYELGSEHTAAQQTLDWYKSFVHNVRQALSDCKQNNEMSATVK